MPYIDAIKRDPLATPISDKMKALLSIAGSVAPRKDISTMTFISNLKLYYATHSGKQ